MPRTTTSPATLQAPGVIVYAQYDLDQPPVHPGLGWCRFVCISDTHSKKFKLPPGDVLLHSGDLSAGGYLANLKKTIDWLKMLDHPQKVIIAGNHDLCLDEAWREGGRLADYWSITAQDYETARDLVLGETAVAAGIHYLEHNTMNLETPGKTWRIHGSPSAPVYSEGAFQYSTRAQAKAIYDRIPSNVDILLTHTPADGILNKTRRGRDAGCPVLAKKMKALPNCRLHLHGHIHESHGAVLVPLKGGGGDEPTSRAVVNGALDKFGMPIIVDLEC